MPGRPQRQSRRTAGIFADEARLADLAMRVYTLERRLRESAILDRVCDYTPAPRWGGRPATLESPARKSTWRALAQVLIERQIGPVDYIVRQFDQNPHPLGRPLLPNELLGPAALRRYHESKDSKLDEVRIERNCGSQIFRRQVHCQAQYAAESDPEHFDSVELWSEVLCDDYFTPMFAYMVSRRLSQEHPDHAESFAGHIRETELCAALEFARFPREYTAVWGDVMPKDFAAFAKRTYKSLLDQVL